MQVLSYNSLTRALGDGSRQLLGLEAWWRRIIKTSRHYDYNVLTVS